MSQILPSPDLTSFSCPHCGAHAAQQWFTLCAKLIQDNLRRPFIPQSEDLDYSQDADPEELAKAKAWVAKMCSKEIFFSEETKNFVSTEIHNIFVSNCFNCKRNSLWHNRNLVFPLQRDGSAPNVDLDGDIQADINEARSILNASPRGAAALLRLAVQKLCRQLGEDGKNIDRDIQKLVDKGMDPHLQQAFDTVRVIGNEAVHPGELNLKDDRQTAITLIDLINIVAQQLISNRKAIAAIYATLPKSKLAGIEARGKGAGKA